MSQLFVNVKKEKQGKSGFGGKGVSAHISLGDFVGMRMLTDNFSLFVF